MRDLSSWNLDEAGTQLELEQMEALATWQNVCKIWQETGDEGDGDAAVRAHAMWTQAKFKTIVHKAVIDHERFVKSINIEGQLAANLTSLRDALNEMVPNRKSAVRSLGDYGLTREQVRHLNTLGILTVEDILLAGFNTLCEAGGANRSMIKGICLKLTENGIEVPK